MADQPIRLLIVDDIASTRDNLQKLLSFEDDIDVIGTAADGKQGIDEARRLHPDIVLTDVNMPLMDGIQLTEQLAQDMPACPVIIMSVQGERDYLRRAMQAGAREFLIKPFSHDELVAAIRRVHALELKKGTFRPSPGMTETEERSTPGEVFVFFSGKGGAGKSVVAGNLAVALAQEAGAKVCLVDLDLQFGDVGVMFNLDHTRSITDLLDVGEAGLDREVLDSVLAEGPGGIRCLLSPISPELADLVTPDAVRNVIGELRKRFDFVIVDTSAHLGEINLQVIETASKVLVVTPLTIPAIKDAKLTLKVLDSLNVDRQNIMLIVNRVDSYSDFNRAAIEQNLGTQVTVEIPHDPKVVGEAITRGQALVVMQPESDASRAIRELAAKLVPMEAVVAGKDDKKKKKGLFGR